MFEIDPSKFAKAFVYGLNGTVIAVTAAECQEMEQPTEDRDFGLNRKRLVRICVLEQDLPAGMLNDTDNGAPAPGASVTDTRGVLVIPADELPTGLITDLDLTLDAETMVWTGHITRLTRDVTYTTEQGPTSIKSDPDGPLRQVREPILVVGLHTVTPTVFKRLCKKLHERTRVDLPNSFLP